MDVICITKHIYNKISELLLLPRNLKGLQKDLNQAYKQAPRLKTVTYALLMLTFIGFIISVFPNKKKKKKHPEAVIQC